MAKTDKLGLNVWGEAENSGTWLAWRLAMAGLSDDSNMKILDAWAQTVEEKIANVQSTLTFDETPTEGSENPVTSGGIYDAIQAHTAKPDLNIRCTFDDTSSAEACQNSTIFEYAVAEVRATYNKLTAGDEQPVAVNLYGITNKGDGERGYTLQPNDVTTTNNKLHVSFLLTPSLIEGLEHVYHAELTFTMNGSAASATFVVTPIDGTTDIGLDDQPVEDSANLVTSGGVWDALKNKVSEVEFVAHTNSSSVHVTSDDKTAWNGKQDKISVSGLLKGDGRGNVTAATAGTDYAVGNHDHDQYALDEHTHNQYALTEHEHSQYALDTHVHDQYAAEDHNHDGDYCTPEDLEEGLDGKAPTFSPVREVAPSGSSGSNSYMQYIDSSCNGTTILASSANIPSYASDLYFGIRGDDDMPVGMECEIIWVGGQKPVAIQPVQLDGVFLCDLHHTLSDDTTTLVKLSSLYSVAVLKKIGPRSWVISGDITL